MILLHYDHNISIQLYNLHGGISVARGGGGGVGGGAGGAAAPPPNNAFSDFCRYIWKFVGTCEPTSMSFVPTKYLMYRQNIERNNRLRM